MSNPEQWLTEAELDDMEKTGRLGGYDAGNVWEFRVLIAMARDETQIREALTRLVNACVELNGTLPEPEPTSTNSRYLRALDEAKQALRPSRGPANA